MGERLCTRRLWDCDKFSKKGLGSRNFAASFWNLGCFAKKLEFELKVQAVASDGPTSLLAMPPRQRANETRKRDVTGADEDEDAIRPYSKNLSVGRATLRSLVERWPFVFGDVGLQ